MKPHVKKRGMLLVLCVTLLAACGSTSQTNSGQVSTHQTKPVEVQITLTDFHITSSLMTFAPGVLYGFTVINQGKTTHELMLMSSTMKTMQMSGTPMHEMDTMALTSVDMVQPGGSRTFVYTFARSTAGLHPEFSCHLPGHYEAGMHLDVTVG